MKRHVTVAIAALLVTASTWTADSEPTAKERFAEVTKYLEKDGDLYVYLSTNAWLEHLRTKAGPIVSTMVSAMDDGKDRELAMSLRDLLRSMVLASGIADISGIGWSSVPRPEGGYRERIYVHHRPTDRPGLIWQALTGETITEELLHFLPATTTWASLDTLNKPVLWHALDAFISQLKRPDEPGHWSSAKAGARAAGLDLEKAVASTASPCGLFLTLDTNKHYRHVLANGQEIKVPDAGIVLFTKVKNDYLFDFLDNQVADNPNISRDSSGELEIRTMAIPLPYPIVLRFSYGKFRNFLFFATNDALIKESVAVYQRGQGGLLGDSAFEALAAGVPRNGMSFQYLHERLSSQIKRLLRSGLDDQQSATQNQAILDAIDAAQQPVNQCFAMEKVESGILITGNASYSLGKSVLAQSSIIPVALLGGLVAPALSKAREKARRIECSTNLKQIGLACLMYSGEHDGEFPPDLTALATEGYVDDGSTWACPGAAARFETPEESNYVYVGAGLRDDMDDPMRVVVAYDHPANHRGDWINVLFVAGNVRGFPSATIDDAVVRFGLKLERR